MTTSLMAKFGVTVERVGELTYRVPRRPYANPPAVQVSLAAAAAGGCGGGGGDSGGGGAGGGGVAAATAAAAAATRAR